MRDSLRTAVCSSTGMFTRPNEMAPFQIDRGISVVIQAGRCRKDRNDEGTCPEPQVTVSQQERVAGQAECYQQSLHISLWRSVEFSTKRRCLLTATEFRIRHTAQRKARFPVTENARSARHAARFCGMRTTAKMPRFLADLV